MTKKKANKKYRLDCPDIGKVAEVNLILLMSKWQLKTKSQTIIKLLSEIHKIYELHDELMDEYQQLKVANEVLTYSVKRLLLNEQEREELKNTLHKSVNKGD